MTRPPPSPWASRCDARPSAGRVRCESRDANATSQQFGHPDRDPRHWLRSMAPASSSSPALRPSSLRRTAAAAPPEPAPTTTWPKLSVCRVMRAPISASSASPGPRRPCGRRGSGQLCLFNAFPGLARFGIDHQLHKDRSGHWPPFGVAPAPFGRVIDAFAMGMAGGPCHVGKPKRRVHHVPVVDCGELLPLWITQCRKWRGRC